MVRHDVRQLLVLDGAKVAHYYVFHDQFLINVIACGSGGWVSAGRRQVGALLRLPRPVPHCHINLIACEYSTASSSRHRYYL